MSGVDILISNMKTSLYVARDIQLDPRVNLVDHLHHHSIFFKKMHRRLANLGPNVPAQRTELWIMTRPLRHCLLFLIRILARPGGWVAISTFSSSIPWTMMGHTHLLRYSC